MTGTSKCARRLQTLYESKHTAKYKPGIRAALGFGEVTNTGWVDTALLVDEFTTY